MQSEIIQRYHLVEPDWLRERWDNGKAVQE
jgi:hypothetical protein